MSDQIYNNKQNPGFTLGLTSIVFGVFAFFVGGWPSLLLSVVGIILGANGHTKSTAVGMSRNVPLTGIVLCGLALGFRIVAMIACTALGITFFSLLTR